jgi:hypothetical protein
MVSFVFWCIYQSCKRKIKNIGSFKAINEKKKLEKNRKKLGFLTIFSTFQPDALVTESRNFKIHRTKVVHNTPTLLLHT